MLPRRVASSLIFLIIAVILSPAIRGEARFDSYEGLVMAGYQGWFNAPGDGSGRGWRHYQGKNGFAPGSCSIDIWPDTREYTSTHETEFRLPSGEPGVVFSSYDKSTVLTHFRWMKEYGIDGVFLQRFIAEIAHDSGRKHFDTVLESAIEGCRLHERALCIMYDLSGMPENGPDILLKDAKSLKNKFELNQRKKIPGYLFHEGKPLIAVWGIGFNDKHSYGLEEAELIVNKLTQMGFSIMIGVPAYWRTLDRDSVRDARLHALIRKCSIVLPWAVGRYDRKSYPSYRATMRGDLEWCGQYGIDYAPLCFPGFSWKNMKGQDTTSIEREAGKFYSDQLSGAIDEGARRLYIAMFDEMDEATAIFKCARQNETPSHKETGFVVIEDFLEPDYYLRLTGEAAKTIREKSQL